MPKIPVTLGLHQSHALDTVAECRTPALDFDEIVIDFQGRRVIPAGAVQRLENKTFDVLALLTASPAQDFLRDEILNAGWGDRHITPGELNRVITLLRPTLGEAAQTPRYLRTLLWR